MRILKAVTTTVMGLALMGAALAPVAQADDWNRKTVMTFSGPVEIPGVHLKGWAILPAGTYVFKILNSQSDRHIVQIFNKDETVVYATVLAIPNYRLKVTDKTVVTFRERPAGQPEALRAWFYPGRNWGEEFVYPRSMAAELAKGSNDNVLYTPTDLNAEVSKPMTTSEPEVMAMMNSQIMAVKPSGEDVDLSSVVTTPPAVDMAPDPAPMAAALPQTASSLPLLALFGLLALGGACALGQLQKRVG